jgi:hypothetical protein
MFRCIVVRLVVHDRCWEMYKLGDDVSARKKLVKHVWCSSGFSLSRSRISPAQCHRDFHSPRRMGGCPLNSSPRLR